MSNAFVAGLEKVGTFFKDLFESKTAQEVVTLGATIAETFLPQFTPLIQSIVTEYAKATQLAASVSATTGTAAQIALIVQGVSSEYATFAQQNNLSAEPAELQALVTLVVNWLEAQKPATAPASTPAA